MADTILLFDTIASNRIVLRVRLMAAQYEVLTCATLQEARDAIAARPPDLLIANVAADHADDGPEPGLDLFRAIRADPDLAAMPIIATASGCQPGARMAAMRAGADDVLDKSVGGAFLHARIRSLLRGRDAVAELRLRGDTHRALGLAEDAAIMVRKRSIAVVTDRTATGAPLAGALGEDTGAACAVLAPADLVAACAAGPMPDLFVIDGSSGAACPGTTYRLVAELRSRSATRHAALLVILPEGCGDMAAMVLDLGANDIAATRASREEVSHRVSVLLRLKQQQDRLRDTLRSGLQAAVTDPLTGLYNRRYALPHLGRLALRSRDSGRGFALLALDIDHFKAVNDLHGHAGGDRVLVEVARRLRDNLRATDTIARIGGEEFLVAMPDTTTEQAQRAAERLRRVFEDTPFDAVEQAPIGRTRRAATKIAVTVSIGVAEGRAGSGTPEETSETLARADAALYAAKHAGRNTVTVGATAA